MFLTHFFLSHHQLLLNKKKGNQINDVELLFHDILLQLLIDRSSFLVNLSERQKNPQKRNFPAGYLIAGENIPIHPHRTL
jgi:hypothetical protein